MEKNTIKIIALIAIVIGSSGLTLGYLTITQPKSTDPIVLLSAIPAPRGKEGTSRTSWCKYVELFNISTTDVWFTINDLVIDFYINQSGAIFCNFVCWLYSGNCYFKILFDGYEQWQIQTNDGYPEWLNHQGGYSFCNTTLSLGWHNVSIQFKHVAGNCSYIRNSTLLAQFFSYS